MEWVFVVLAAGLAGFVDAVVGGGGLIQVPTLFAAFPQAHPATLLGVNKGASVWGTAAATWRYARQVDMRWHALLPAALVCFCAAFAGAWLVTLVSAEYLRQALPVVLVLLLLYTLYKKDLGREHQPRFAGRREAMVMGMIGLSVGFYDGFFGPGTGSFLVFLCVRWLGYDFLHASAAAKWLNATSNVAAILLFASKGHIWWHWALALGLANMAGSLLGTRVAIRHGAAFVRSVFLLVVAALVVKTGWSAYWGA